MTVLELKEQFGLAMETETQEGLNAQVDGVYIGDLLSWVMGNLQAGNAWLTIQGHTNIVAVASLAEASCIILTEGSTPDAATVTQANTENIPILTSSLSSYRLAKQLAAAGL